MKLKQKEKKEALLPHKSSILSGLQYKVDENPPWITTILLGFQHYLTLIGSGLAIPDIVAGTICAKGTPEETHVKAVLFGNMVFASGLCTLVQSYIGTRLPIVQCVAFSYVVPMLAMRKLDRWTCPDYSDPGFHSNATLNNNHSLAGGDEKFYVLQMNQLIGSIMAAAVLEIAIGASGMIGLLLRFIGPLTVAPTIILIGLSVAEYAFGLAGKHWGISAATIVLIILLSEILPVFEFRYPFQRKGDKKSEFVMHKIYSVILTVCFMWLLCYIFTVTGVLPSDNTSYGYEARTDLRLGVISQSSWFRFPYPGNWGKPSFSSAIFVAMIAGVITSVIESIGDYYTCARIAGAHPPPAHAINRGILVEGIDCILSSTVGIGYGVTSCSQNIGVISLTKVGSRRVALMAGVIMMVFGCLSKINALAMSMPDPIIGASCLVLFGVLTAVGASNLQYVNLNSSRNLLVFGISLFVGIGFPGWMVQNSSLIATGNENLDQVLNALLANTMFMGAFSALILDNVIPGTLEDRGILSWRETPDQPEEEKQESKDSRIDLKTYDLPFVTKYIRRWKYTKYIPFLPTFGTRDESKVDLAEAEVVFSPDDGGHVTLVNNVENIDENEPRKNSA